MERDAAHAFRSIHDEQGRYALESVPGRYSAPKDTPCITRRHPRPDRRSTR